MGQIIADFIMPTEGTGDIPVEKLRDSKQSQVNGTICQKKKQTKSKAKMVEYDSDKEFHYCEMTFNTSEIDQNLLSTIHTFPSGPYPRTP